MTTEAELFKAYVASGMEERMSFFVWLVMYREAEASTAMSKDKDGETHVI